MTIDERLTNLEKLVYSYIESQSRADEYSGYDIDGCRHTDEEQQESIESNSKDIIDTQLGLTDTFEMVDVTMTEITQVEEAVTELYEMIIQEV